MHASSGLRCLEALWDAPVFSVSWVSVSVDVERCLIRGLSVCLKSLLV